MKHKFTLKLLLPLASALIVIVLPARADQFKTNNLVNLELGSSWSSGVAPAGNDFAIWDATVATPANCTNTLGVPLLLAGYHHQQPRRAGLSERQLLIDLEQRHQSRRCHG